MRETPQRPPLVPIASVFYGVFGVLAVLWALIADRPGFFWLGSPPAPDRLLLHGLLGLAVGFLVVVASRVLTRLLPGMTELVDWFGEVLGSVSWWEAFCLAALSSVGEELLFRGAMQPTLGLLATSVLFGLVHWPWKQRLLVWPIFALIMGVVLGLLFEQTGNLLAPIAAHFLINFLNLGWIGEEQGSPS